MGSRKSDIAFCPECDAKVSIKGKPRLGQTIVCKACGTTLEIVDTAPLELDWAFEDPEYEDEELIFDESDEY